MNFSSGSTAPVLGHCADCGMTGRGVHYVDCPVLQPKNILLTADDVRRIVREELERRSLKEPPDA